MFNLEKIKGPSIFWLPDKKFKERHLVFLSISQDSTTLTTRTAVATTTNVFYRKKPTHTLNCKQQLTNKQIENNLKNNILSLYDIIAHV